MSEVSWRLEAPVDAGIANEVARVAVSHPHFVDHWFDLARKIQVWSSRGSCPEHENIRRVTCVECRVTPPSSPKCERCRSQGWYFEWKPETVEQVLLSLRSIVATIDD